MTSTRSLSRLSLSMLRDDRPCLLGDLALFGRRVVRLSVPLATVEADLPGPSPLRGIVAVVWPKPPAPGGPFRVTSLQIHWIVWPTEEDKRDVDRLVHEMRMQAFTEDPDEDDEDEGDPEGDDDDPRWEK